MRRTASCLLLSGACVLHWAGSAAADPPAPAGTADPAADATTPAISIIIDDMGYRLHDGLRALTLPGPVAYSVLPHSPDGASLADAAAAAGKDVLLHLPMQAREDNQLLGPGAIMADMSREQVETTVRADFAAVPHAIGVNNHMGSLLTAEAKPMQWVMEAIKSEGQILFVDSRTTGRTVAARTAVQFDIPTLGRDVFLDDEENRQYIRGQLFRLIEKARRDGYALAIGHPKPETLDVLSETLPDLERYGVRLVSLRELLAIQKRRDPEWQVSLSRWPKAVKN
jgi:uncharacterized protein